MEKLIRTMQAGADRRYRNLEEDGYSSIPKSDSISAMAIRSIKSSLASPGETPATIASDTDFLARRRVRYSIPPGHN